MKDFIIWLLSFVLPRRLWYRRLYLRSNHWRILSRATREARGKCEACYRKLDISCLHAHHLTYKRLWFERPSDLQVLCRECHRKAHR